MKRGAKESDLLCGKNQKGVSIYKGGKPSRWESGRFLVAVIYLCLRCPVRLLLEFFLERTTLTGIN